MTPLTMSAERFAYLCEEYSNDPLVKEVEAQSAALSAAQEEIRQKDAKFEAHTKAVGAFLAELHALTLDPLAEGETSVDEMMQQLRLAAIVNRDNLAEQMSRAESAEEEITRLTAERDNYKQVATDHLNQPVNLRDYQNVTKAVVYEHKRAESAEATLRQVQEIVERRRGAHDRGLMVSSNYAMNELEALLRVSAGETK